MILLPLLGWACATDAPRAPETPACPTGEVCAPAPVRFSLTNGGAAAATLPADHQGAVRFTLRSGGAVLHPPEHDACPTPCPASGMPGEIDCGRRPDRVVTVEAGASVAFTWSATQEVENWRSTGGAAPQFCTTVAPSAPGAYEVEVCTIDRRCTSARFVLPADTVVTLRLP